jgi:Pyruvate/2-oxoacid:ferredoxin oxidoreductase gamma subunit
MLKVIVSGKGGQGIQFLAQLVCKTAIHKGLQVTLMKSYGPEARGGASQASFVIDGNVITNPVVKQADYLVAFSKEAVDMWGPRSKTVIYHDNMNNMEMLGIFIKTIGEDIEPIIETMKREISSKYTDRIEVNTLNLIKGFNSITYIPNL